MVENIHVFHTNDLHSHFENWPRIQAFVQQQRELLAAKGEPSFLVDIGDHVDRSAIYTEATLGKGNVALLNEAQYDAVTIGNNEGITLAHEDLYTLYDEAHFDVVIANLRSLRGEDPAWLKPYTILTTASDVKIGVIGATAAYPVFYEDLGWQVEEPRAAIAQVVYQLKPQVDILLCLSHLGKTEDELLAQQCPEIDVIFGAHTHHVFPNGEMIDDTLLTGGGKFGHYVGHCTLQFNHDTRQVVQKQDMLYESAMLAAVNEEMQYVADLHARGKDILNEPLFQLHKTYTKEWFHYSPIANVFAQALLAHTKADCAMFNAGLFLQPLAKGYVSAYHFHEILPHPINACIIELSGHELKEVLQQCQNEEWPNLQLKGLGFRGVVFGKMLTYNFALNEQRQLLIKGEIANLDETYKLATLDMFTFGFFFPSFKYAKKQYVLPLFLRDILRQHFVETYNSI